MNDRAASTIGLAINEADSRLDRNRRWFAFVSGMERLAQLSGVFLANADSPDRALRVVDSGTAAALRAEWDRLARELYASAVVARVLLLAVLGLLLFLPASAATAMLGAAAFGVLAGVLPELYRRNRAMIQFAERVRVRSRISELDPARVQLFLREPHLFGLNLAFCYGIAAVVQRLAVTPAHCTLRLSLSSPVLVIYACAVAASLALFPAKMAAASRAHQLAVPSMRGFVATSFVLGFAIGAAMLAFSPLEGGDAHGVVRAFGETALVVGQLPGV